MRMAEPIYRVWMARFTEAWYQLSEEERQQHGNRRTEAFQSVGGKAIVSCFSAWSAEQWGGFGVEEFPDIEAVQKYTQLLAEMNHYRYLECFSMLGTGGLPS
jgi:hypothetical protein